MRGNNNGNTTCLDPKCIFAQAEQDKECKTSHVFIYSINRQFNYRSTNVDLFAMIILSILFYIVKEKSLILSDANNKIMICVSINLNYLQFVI